VAAQPFCRLEGPHLDHAAAPLAGRPEERVGRAARGIQPADFLGARLGAAGEAPGRFGQRKVVNHADKFRVEAARVAYLRAEKAVGADVVDPHSLALGALLAHHALHRAAAHEKLLEHARVELRQAVVVNLGVDLVLAAAEVAHYGLH